MYSMCKMNVLVGTEYHIRNNEILYQGLNDQHRDIKATPSKLHTTPSCEPNARKM